MNSEIKKRRELSNICVSNGKSYKHTMYNNLYSWLQYLENIIILSFGGFLIVFFFVCLQVNTVNGGYGCLSLVCLSHLAKPPYCKYILLMLSVSINIFCDVELITTIKVKTNFAFSWFAFDFHLQFIYYHSVLNYINNLVSN